MIVRRFLAAGLLFAFLAPLLVPSLAELAGAGPRRRSGGAGGACCAAMACCAMGAPCATGACDRGPSAAYGAGGSPAGATSNAHGASLAAACPGPAPATTAADRDPMLPASVVALPGDAARGDLVEPMPVDFAARDDSPSVPPPRA